MSPHQSQGSALPEHTATPATASTPAPRAATGKRRLRWGLLLRQLRKRQLAMLALGLAYLAWHLYAALSAWLTPHI